MINTQVKKIKEVDRQTLYINFALSGGRYINDLPNATCDFYVFNFAVHFLQNGIVNDFFCYQKQNVLGINRFLYGVLSPTLFTQYLYEQNVRLAEKIVLYDFDSEISKEMLLGKTGVFAAHYGYSNGSMYKDIQDQYYPSETKKLKDNIDTLHSQDEHTFAIVSYVGFLIGMKHAVVHIVQKKQGETTIFQYDSLNEILYSHYYPHRVGQIKNLLTSFNIEHKQFQIDLGKVKELLEHVKKQVATIENPQTFTKNHQAWQQALSLVNGIDETKLFSFFPENFYPSDFLFLLACEHLVALTHIEFPEQNKGSLALSEYTRGNELYEKIIFVDLTLNLDDIELNSEINDKAWQHFRMLTHFYYRYQQACKSTDVYGMVVKDRSGRYRIFSVFNGQLSGVNTTISPL